jgi:LPXTG-motif cell wall-anchored protein
MATIEIVDFAFAPADLTVDAGTTVIWTNTGENDHTVTGDDGSFLSKRLAPGDAYRHTFRAAGRFAYHCSLHESMEARIVVRGGGATSTTAASTTSSTPSTTAPSTTTPSSAPSTTITTVVTPDDLAKTGIGSPTTWLLLVGIALALGGVYVVWTRGPRPVMAQTRSSLPSRKELPEDLHARRRDERHGRD